jgi:hypothetical protein
MDRTCNTHSEIRNAYIILVETPGETRPLLIPDNIKVYLSEKVCENMDRIYLSHYVVQRSVSWQRSNQPSIYIKLGEFID